MCDVTRLSTIRTQSFLGILNFSRMVSVISIFVRLMMVLLYYMVKNTDIFKVFWQVSFREQCTFFPDLVLSQPSASRACLHPSMSQWSYWMDFRRQYDFYRRQSRFQKSHQGDQSIHPSAFLPIQRPLDHVHRLYCCLHDENHGILKTVLLWFHQPRFLSQARDHFSLPVSNALDHVLNGYPLGTAQLRHPIVFEVNMIHSLLRFYH